MIGQQQVKRFPEFHLIPQMKTLFIMKSNPKQNLMRFLLIAILIFIVSCRQQESATTQPEPAKTDSIKVFILKKDSIKKTISLPGEIIPLEKVLIRAKVAGYVKKLNVDISSRVKKGHTLAIIDVPEINI